MPIQGGLVVLFLLAKGWAVLTEQAAAAIIIKKTIHTCQSKEEGLSNGHHHT